MSDRMKAMQLEQEKFCVEVAELGLENEPLKIYFTKIIFDEADRQVFLGMDVSFVTALAGEILQKLFADDVTLETSEKK